MDKEQLQRILDLLKQSFDPESMIHFSAVAVMEQERVEYPRSITIKGRMALSFQEGQSINPYSH